MAAFALTSCYVAVGVAWTGTAPGGTSVPSGTIATPLDCSGFVTSVSMEFSSDELDTTGFTSGGYRSKITGLATGTATIEINQDYAASQGDAIFGLGGTCGWAPGQSTPYYLDIRATSAARSATNPSFVAAWVSTSYQPLAGGVGDLAKITLNLPLVGRIGRLTS